MIKTFFFLSYIDFLYYFPFIQGAWCPTLFNLKSDREELYYIYLMYFVNGIRFD